MHHLVAGVVLHSLVDCCVYRGGNGHISVSVVTQSVLKLLLTLSHKRVLIDLLFLLLLHVLLTPSLSGDLLVHSLHVFAVELIRSIILATVLSFEVLRVVSLIQLRGSHE